MAKKSDLIDQIDRIRGRMSVLEGLILALIANQPNQKQLAKAIGAISEGLIALSTPTSLSDQFLAGQLEAIENVKPVLAAMAAPTQSSP